MSNIFGRGRGGDPHDLEAQLRAARSEPGDDLIDAITAQVSGAARAPRRRRAAGALAISLAVLATAASLGGVSDAASTLSGASGAVRHFFSGQPSAAAPKASAVIGNAYPHPNYTVNATPTKSHVKAGHQVSVRIKVKAHRGFSGTVTLGTQPLPAGFSVSFVPTSGSGSFDSMAVVSVAPGTAEGTYVVVVTATSGTTTKVTTFKVTVT
jgi:hypothetical protein